jgi:GNAT superfamily N-acetyltransferase
VIRNPAVTVQSVATPAGILSTRPEAPIDEAFLFTLFESVKGPDIARMPVDDHMKLRLLQMQYTAMTQSYRKSFTTEAFNIITLDNTPIGRLIVEETNNCICIVYIALLPAWRHRGIGSQLMRALLTEAQARHLPCEATVALDNIPSLRLWVGLGFTEQSRDTANVILRWRPPLPDPA